MSKYKVAEGFAFTAGGVVYAEGDEISLEQFGGNEAAFSVACEKGMIITVPDGKGKDKKDGKTPPDDGDGGKGSQKTLEALTKKELEEIKEIGRAVDALKKDTARIEREVNEIFKRIDPILEKE